MTQGQTGLLALFPRPLTLGKSTPLSQTFSPHLRMATTYAGVKNHNH